MADYGGSSKSLAPGLGVVLAALGTPLGSVKFASSGVDGLRAQALIGDGANPVPQREQIISIIDRIRRESLTQWDGFRPPAFDFPIMLDSWSSNNTIEEASQALDTMAGTHPDGPDRPTRIVWDTSGVIPYDYSQYPNYEWWITKVDRSNSNVIRSQTGNRRRETITVSLVKYTSDEYLDSLGQRNWERKAKVNSKAKRPYTVKKGDTLVTIAKHQLKNARRWQEIAQLNGKRGENDIKVGERLNLP